MFHTMQSSLNFKYPRARKLLLMVWSMKSLKSSSKLSLPVHDIHTRQSDAALEMHIKLSLLLICQVLCTVTCLIYVSIGAESHMT